MVVLEKGLVVSLLMSSSGGELSSVRSPHTIVYPWNVDDDDDDDDDAGDGAFEYPTISVLSDVHVPQPPPPPMDTHSDSHCQLR